ncbi:hypothetical protein Pyn_12462 [Prunus yedoensis var. nudiflora]|uniref:Uncharacterized protein n=1 Tax=Prunus yedoensis var. nudiflora TaxID=2094558 RepID=A0A314Z5P0_PRUYE|nr:hypothetical protein Pyn_12462 [Prunus yedoensis var. nudiflora]
MSTSSDGNANQGDSDGSWEYAPDYPRSPLPPLPLPTSSASEGDSNDPAVEINDMKNKLEHNSSLVHYWTQKCVGAEQKLAYLKRQVNKGRYRKEKHIICGQRRKHKAEDLHMTLRRMLRTNLSASTKEATSMARQFLWLSTKVLRNSNGSLQMSTEILTGTP